MAAAGSRIRKAELKVIAGSASPSRLRLHRSPLSLGAAGDCDLVCRGEKVSPVHATLELDADSGDWILRNKSHFGSLLNRERIDVAVVRPGDRIQLGESALLEFRGKLAQEATDKPRSGRGISARQALLVGGLTVYGLLLVGVMLFLGQARNKAADTGLSAEYLETVMNATREHLETLPAAAPGAGIPARQLTGPYFRIAAERNEVDRAQAIDTLLAELDSLLFQAWLAEQRADQADARRLYERVRELVPDVRAPVAQVAVWRLGELQKMKR